MVLSNVQQEYLYHYLLWCNLFWPKNTERNLVIRPSVVDAAPCRQPSGQCQRRDAPNLQPQILPLVAPHRPILPRTFRHTHNLILCRLEDETNPRLSSWMHRQTPLRLTSLFSFLFYERLKKVPWRFPHAYSDLIRDLLVSD